MPMVQASATARLHLLDTPHLRFADRRLDLPDSLPGYLLAYLSVRADWVARESIAALFWPDAGQEESQHNLRVNLNRLRSLLQKWGLEPALVAERRRVRAGFDTDVADLRHASAATNWQAAVAVPQAPFMYGIGFRAFPVLEEWARSERHALQTQWRNAILAGAPNVAPAAARQWADRFLEFDPFDEDVLRVALSALSALGRADDATRLFHRFRDRMQAELGLEVSAGLAEFVQRLSAPVAAASLPAAAAPPAGRLIGREPELAAIDDLLRTSRLVTLVGGAGVGKTRLAREAMQQVAGRFPAGVCWVSLATVERADDAAACIAEALQVRLSGRRDPLEHLIEKLSADAVLLLLDNAEHLLDGAPPSAGYASSPLHATITGLLDACPRVRLLVTSRQRLRHAAEAVLDVASLPLPAPDETGTRVLASPAVQLFVAHAQRALPSFDPRAVADDIAQVCRLTGGLPLALELAAPWARLLSCRQIAEELARGLDALDASDTAGAGVRAAIDRSWRRLTDGERRVLAALGVFAGPFDALAARAAADAGLAALGSLADRSLLQVGTQGDRTVFDMHPLIRQFARERLAEDAGAHQLTHQRHAAHVARVLAPYADFRSIDQRAALVALEQVLADSLAAWSWACSRGDVDFVVQAALPLMHYFEQKGRLPTGIALFAQAEALFDPAAGRELAALVALGRARATLLFRWGDYVATDELARRTLRWARATGNASALKALLNLLGLAAWQRSRDAEAHRFFEQARTRAVADGDRAGEAVFLGNLALIAKKQGEFALAEQQWRAALALHRQTGNTRSACTTLHNLGSVVAHFGRHDEACRLLEEGLRACNEHGFDVLRPTYLATLAQVHGSCGRSQQAEELARLALQEARRTSNRQIEIAALILIAESASAARNFDAARGDLESAMRLARTHDDLPHLIESLSTYAHWLALQGDTSRAAVLWTLALTHPQLHAQLRPYVEAHLAEFAPSDAQRDSARGQAATLDFTAQVESALAALRAPAHA